MSEQRLNELVPLIKQSIEDSDKCDVVCRENGNKSVQSAIAAGKYLTEAKSLVVHGEWEKWLTDNFSMSIKTAERWMKLADPSHETILKDCPTRRQAYIRLGLVKPSKVDIDAIQRYIIDQYSDGEDESPDEDETTATNQKPKKELTPYEKSKKLRDSLMKYFQTNCVDLDDVRLLIPFVVIYEQYLLLLQKETFEPVDISEQSIKPIEGKPELCESDWRSDFRRKRNLHLLFLERFDELHKQIADSEKSSSHIQWEQHLKDKTVEQLLKDINPFPVEEKEPVAA